jgi:hypothetical protein
MIDVRSVITAEAEVLSPHLYECVAESLQAARRRLAGLDYSMHPIPLPMVLRAEARERLKQRVLPSGWEVAGESRLMEQLQLEHPGHLFELRFLKERRRAYPGGVPAAGPNSSRRRAWDQYALDLDLDVAAAAPTLTTFLLVWDLKNSKNLDDGFTLRVVHPLKPGTYGQAVPCDLSLDLLPGGGIFDRLAFKGDAEDTDLFENVEIAETANDE